MISSFDLTDPFTLLRIICGLFFIPHIFGKFFVPQALELFVEAGYKPPKVWMYVAAAIEIVIAIGLVLGIYTMYVAILGAVHLLIAAGTVWMVTKGKWLWNIGGCEYPVFWAICCVVVALHG